MKTKIKADSAIIRGDPKIINIAAINNSMTSQKTHNQPPDLGQGVGATQQEALQTSVTSSEERVSVRDQLSMQHK